MDLRNVMKTSVSRLQEWCAKKKYSLPVYEMNAKRTGGFECCVRIEYYSKVGMGSGSSKRIAKHAAAEDLIEKLRRHGYYDGYVNQTNFIEFEGFDEPEVPVEMTGEDMILQLRNYCVRQRQPIPVYVFDCEGPADGSEYYVVTCKLGDTETRAQSKDRMCAKQLAAREMLIHFNVGGENEVQLVASSTSYSSRSKEKEEEDNKKFAIYGRLTNELECKDANGVSICDRHNYFSRYPAHLKQAAFAVINTKYDNDRDQAMDVLKALKLTPTIKQAPSLGAPMLMIELDCDYEAIFVDLETNVFRNVVEYFSTMLL